MIRPFASATPLVLTVFLGAAVPAHAGTPALAVSCAHLSVVDPHGAG